MKDERRLCSWPVGWKVLFVDDDEVVRRTYSAQLEHVVSCCFSAASYDEARTKLNREEGIRLVITDHGVRGDSTQRFVEHVRLSAPEAVIVVSSGSDCREELASLGVERFLKKPWRVNDLFDLLSRSLSQCVDCKSPLPLRLPFPGEAGESWVCSFCGERYWAVLDANAPRDLLAFVHHPRPL